MKCPACQHDNEASALFCHPLTETATRLAGNLGAVNEIFAEIGQCDFLACANDWGAVSDAATDTLLGVRARGVERLWEPKLLDLIGVAEIERGNAEASRAASQEGVVFMRKSQSAWNPHCDAVLALAESAADIAGTLDEYESLLTRAGFHIYEGELHELRARLAEREGQQAERAAALARAQACYTRFGMAAQAARVADALGDAA